MKLCDRFGHTQAAVGKIIYVFGGRMGTSIDEKLLDDLWAFDTDSKTWSEVDAKDKESAPSPRSFHTSVVVGECIYIFGGCPKEGRQADLHRFDTRTKRNSRLFNMIHNDFMQEPSQNGRSWRPATRFAAEEARPSWPPPTAKPSTSSEGSRASSNMS